MMVTDFVTRYYFCDLRFYFVALLLDCSGLLALSLLVLLAVLSFSELAVF